ncbi:MAG TPA: hypothetical protein PL064_13645, partial [Thermogutta sp.]|nr:hypothetical protein [Thermogutta sp.]
MTATARPTMETVTTQGTQVGEMVFGGNTSRLVYYIVAKAHRVSNGPGWCHEGLSISRGCWPALQTWHTIV